MGRVGRKIARGVDAFAAISIGAVFLLLLGWAVITHDAPL